MKKQFTMKLVAGFKFEDLENIWKTKAGKNRQVTQIDNFYGFYGGKKFDFYSQNDGIFYEGIRVAKNWKSFDRNIQKILILLNLEPFLKNFSECIEIITAR